MYTLNATIPSVLTASDMSETFNHSAAISRSGLVGSGVGVGVGTGVGGSDIDTSMGSSGVVGSPATAALTIAMLSSPDVADSMIALCAPSAIALLDAPSP